MHLDGKQNEKEGGRIITTWPAVSSLNGKPKNPPMNLLGTIMGFIKGIGKKITMQNL